MRRPVGLLLAGGAASRMGGGDKGLLDLEGRPILAHAAARLRPQCVDVWLSANGDPTRFAALDMPVLADHPEDRGAGPLAGVLAGLDALACRRPEATHLLTAPCDTPFLPADLAARLDACRGAGAAAARSGGREHPLAALWPVAAREPLRRRLRHDGLRRVRDALEAIGCAWAEWPVRDGHDPFANLNTPEDLSRARNE